MVAQSRQRCKAARVLGICTNDLSFVDWQCACEQWWKSAILSRFCITELSGKAGDRGEELSKRQRLSPLNSATACEKKYEPGTGWIQ